MAIKRTLLLVLLALMLSGAGLWWTNPGGAPPEATWADVQAEARRGGYRLISTQEMAALCRREGEKPLLIDTRQEWEYRTGHLEAAVNFPVEPTWWGRVQARRPLARLLGPDQDRALVFY